MYFSLLKSQIFSPSSLSDNKAESKENLHKRNNSLSDNKPPTLKKDDYFHNNTINNNISSIVKNLNKSFCDSTEPHDTNHIQFLPNTNQKKIKQSFINTSSYYSNNITSLFDICNNST